MVRMVTNIHKYEPREHNMQWRENTPHTHGKRVVVPFFKRDPSNAECGVPFFKFATPGSRCGKWADFFFSPENEEGGGGKLC